MNLLFITCISVLFISSSWAALTATEFETSIEPVCFRLNEKGVPYVNGQEKPLASTLENFIALAEKFELANPRGTLKDELFYFIRNYTYTNIEYSSLGDIVRWTPKDSSYADIDQLWEPDENRRLSRPNAEDPFSDAEKCSLYFMISHSIVRKARKMAEQRSEARFQNNDTIYIQNGTSGARKTKWGSDIVYDDDRLYPLEQGVVAIQGTEEAVSLGRVLTGMYVGLQHGRKRDIASFTRILPEYIQPDKGTVVDPLYSLTIAEVLALAAWRPEAGQRDGFALNGNWMSVPIQSDIDTKNVCPMVYRLRDATENAVSYSSLRGAADGLIIGKVIGAIEAKRNDVKLSQILRQYYSRGGFVGSVPDLGDIRATFCNRQFLLDNWRNMIQEQVHLFLLLASTSYKNIDNNLAFTMKKYEEIRSLGVLQNINREIKDYCGVEKSIDAPENLPLETPLDVIVVLETSTTDDNFKREQLIIGSLARRLQLSYTGSRVTIFTDQKVLPPSVSVPGMIYLKTIVDNTYSPACAACMVTQIAADPSASIPEEEVIIAINQFLSARRQNETASNGVNGKVVILFNFEEEVPVVRNPTQIRLEKALSELYLEHQDVSLFALGKNIEVLKRYTKDDQAFVMSAFDLAEEEVGKQLHQKVIHAPAKLQYSDCKDAKSEKSAIFQGYVSPNSVQHWMMPAKYFYKSFSLKFVFESDYGAAKVCHSRSTPNPELQKESCQDIVANGKPVEIKHKDPCKGFKAHSCSPFYFSFMGVNVTDGTDKDYCDDKMTDTKCKTLDQIKFKVSHEGIRCNGAIGLMTSSLSVIFALIASHLFFKLA